VEQAAAAAIMQVLSDEEGNLLVFLPGVREIERTAALLENRLGAGIAITPLYGALDAGAQNAAIPARRARQVQGCAGNLDCRKCTDTIEDVRLVIDSGLSRVCRCLNRQPV